MVTVELVGGPLDGQRWKIREDPAPVGEPSRPSGATLMFAVTPTARGDWYCLVPVPARGAEMTTPPWVRRGVYRLRAEDHADVHAAPRMEWQGEERI